MQEDWNNVDQMKGQTAGLANAKEASGDDSDKKALHPLMKAVYATEVTVFDNLGSGFRV